MKRLRLATQVRSNRFGVVCVLDGLLAAGKSRFVMEHEMESSLASQVMV